MSAGQARLLDPYDQPALWAIALDPPSGSHEPQYGWKPSQTQYVGHWRMCVVARFLSALRSLTSRSHAVKHAATHQRNQQCAHTRFRISTKLNRSHKKSMPGRVQSLSFCALCLCCRVKLRDTTMQQNGRGKGTVEGFVFSIVPCFSYGQLPPLSDQISVPVAWLCRWYRPGHIG